MNSSPGMLGLVARANGRSFTPAEEEEYERLALAHQRALKSAEIRGRHEALRIGLEIQRSQTPIAVWRRTQAAIASRKRRVSDDIK